MPSVDQTRLSCAVIGAGPAGLGALIALSKLEGVDVQVYEQAKELRQVGAGISVQNNGHVVLEKLGVPSIPETSFFRNPDRKRNEHWNGRTGEFIKAQLDPRGVPSSRLHLRTQRHRLQEALLKVVPPGRIHLNRRLASVESLPSGQVTLRFEDGFSTTVDLVVGADGIRSAVRRHAFPSHNIAYTGRVAYRTIFPLSRLNHVDDPLGVRTKTLFLHGPDGRWFYSSPLGDGLFEITASTLEPKELGTAVSWGQPAKVEELAKHFTEFLPTIRAIIQAVPEETLSQYASFSGAQLASVVSGGKIALLGDASHPLSGAFGAGAAFALEDAWTLSQAVSYTLQYDLPHSEALRIFDETRSPYYQKLYAELVSMGAAAEKGKDLPWDERAKDRIEERWGDLEWIYSHDIDAAWSATLAREAASVSTSSFSSSLKTPAVLLVDQAAARL